MKRILLMCILICTVMISMAQTDSTKNAQGDTIHIGGMVITRNPEEKRDNKDWDRGRPWTRSRKNNHHSAVSTNVLILDLGFSNYDDQTNYASVDAQAYAPGSNSTGSIFGMENHGM